MSLKDNGERKKGKTKETQFIYVKEKHMDLLSFSSHVSKDNERERERDWKQTCGFGKRSPAALSISLDVGD